MEQSSTRAEQDRCHRYGQLIHESDFKELADQIPAVHVDLPETKSLPISNCIHRFLGVKRKSLTWRRWTVGEDVDGSVSVRKLRHVLDELVSGATHGNQIDAGQEIVKAVVLVFAR